MAPCKMFFTRCGSVAVVFVMIHLVYAFEKFIFLFSSVFTYGIPQSPSDSLAITTTITTAELAQSVFRCYYYFVQNKQDRLYSLVRLVGWSAIAFSDGM